MEADATPPKDETRRVRGLESRVAGFLRRRGALKDEELEDLAQETLARCVSLGMSVADRECDDAQGDVFSVARRVWLEALTRQARRARREQVRDVGELGDGLLGSEMGDAGRFAASLGAEVAEILVVIRKLLSGVLEARHVGDCEVGIEP
jgi:DNA-directed RNA polymerase specialized sigma24 family protein